MQIMEINQFLRFQILNLSFGKISFFFFVFFYPFFIFSESTWNKGAIVLEKGYLIDGEYSSDNKGVYFRQDGQGKYFEHKEIRSIVDVDYAKKIRKSSPGNAAIESIYKFNAGDSFRFSKNGEAGYINDRVALTSKITSLAFVLYFYFDTMNKKQAVSNSIVFVNYDQSKNEFLTSRTNFYYSSAIFLGLVAYFAFNAYMNFDTNREGHKTGTFESKDINLKEYLSMQFPERSSLLYGGPQGTIIGDNQILKYEKSILFNY